MSPRDRSPVKTSSPRRPSGQDHRNQMSSAQSDIAAVGIELLVHLARGELAPRLSLVSPKVFFSILSPMEFCFLAAVASGLLGWGHFISSDIVDLIAQILFKAHGSHCAWLSSCFSVFVSFSCFFVCQTRSVSPGKNC